jgi:hypothetical protein
MHSGFGAVSVAAVDDVCERHDQAFVVDAAGHPGEVKSRVDCP